MENQLQKILVTGSSGHSGRELCKLLKNQYEIIGADLLKGEFTTFIGNLTDKDFVEKITKNVDAIIHTASLHAPHVTQFSREDFIDTNIKGTLYLLESAANNNVQKFIYTSTTSLYGESLEDNEKAVWVTEETPTIPRDIYDITKIAAEGLCKDFFNINSLQTTVLRISRFWNEPMAKKVFYRMYRGLDVSDVAQAHHLAIQTHLETFELFNISAQSIFTKEDLFDLKNHTRDLLKSRIPKIFEYYAKHKLSMPSSIDRVYVIDKAKQILGYQPQYNIHQLLES